MSPLPPEVTVDPQRLTDGRDRRVSYALTDQQSTPLWRHWMVRR